MVGAVPSCSAFVPRLKTSLWSFVWDRREWERLKMLFVRVGLSWLVTHCSQWALSDCGSRTHWMEWRGTASCIFISPRSNGGTDFLQSYSSSDYLLCMIWVMHKRVSVCLYYCMPTCIDIPYFAQFWWCSSFSYHALNNTSPLTQFKFQFSRCVNLWVIA